MSIAVRSEFEETTVTLSLPIHRALLSNATHEKSTGVPTWVLIPQGIFASETDALSAAKDAPSKRRRTEWTLSIWLSIAFLPHFTNKRSTGVSSEIIMLPRDRRSVMRQKLSINCNYMLSNVISLQITHGLITVFRSSYFISFTHRHYRLLLLQPLLPKVCDGKLRKGRTLSITISFDKIRSSVVSALFSKRRCSAW